MSNRITLCSWWEKSLFKTNVIENSLVVAKGEEGGRDGLEVWD